MRAVSGFFCFLTAAYAQREELPKAPTDIKPGSITYEDIEYPYPVAYLPITIYGQDVRMAYMDVPPAGQPNGRTVMLFHGMNFGGFYFSGPIEVLRKEGFRVIVPDQIGFGRSSKPVIPYNFHDMALNSRRLLQSLGISKVTIVGHSMGGMLSARFAASFPDITERAVIYDPIGLTDPRYGGRGEAPMRPTRQRSRRPTISAGRVLRNIRRYFPSPGMEARIRAVRPHPLRPDAERRLAAAGDGALHLSADVVPRPRGLRLAKNQSEDPGYRRREGRAGFSETRQTHCRQHPRRGTDDHP